MRMNLALVSAILPLVAAGSYTLLLLTLLLRRGHRRDQLRWFLAFLLASIFAQLILFTLGLSPALPNLFLKALLLATIFLGIATTFYVDWPFRRPWLLGGGALLLLVFLLDVALPQPVVALSLPVLIVPTVGGLLGLGVWLLFHLLVIVKSYRQYQATQLPWHANRLLHWATYALTVALGEALLFLQDPLLSAAGQLLRFFGVFGLSRAVASHRLFDLRAELRQGLAFLLVALLSALPAGILLFQAMRLERRLGLTPGQTYAATIVLLTVAFLLYQPVRRVVERIVYRYLVGQAFDTARAARGYSQVVAGALEIEWLAQVIVAAIGDLLQTSRGNLMLVSQAGDGWTVETVTRHRQQGKSETTFPAGSLFLNALAERRAPVLQYDLDFNPHFAALTTDERVWLVQQAMEVYVPVNDGDRLSGIIALGPKRSGLPYRTNELELVQVLAEQTVIALQNARLYTELDRQNEQIRRLNVDLRRQYERLEILDRIKSDFITIASHELRTPLSQIKGYADILAAMNDEGSLTPQETRELLGYVSRASSRLEELITAMLDASEMEVSGLQLLLGETHLETILQMATRPLLPALRQRHLSLDFYGLAAVPPLYADFQRLIQAFRNIVGNAIKYTPDYGTINVSARLVPGINGAGDHVEVVVADSGIGIDATYHDLIFEKFFRIGSTELHSTGSTKFKGAGPGLGLHIARGVVEAHGGRIWVESEGEDEDTLPGSRFHVLLPIHAEAGAVDVPAPLRDTAFVNSSAP